MTRTAAATALVLAALIAGPALALPHAHDPSAALRGRVAGAPQACIMPSRYGSGSRSFDDGSLLYEGAGSTIYLNHIADCPALRWGRTIVERNVGDRLCRGDVITVVDPITHADYGGCPLGDFVPYSRPKKK